MQAQSIESETRREDALAPSENDHSSRRRSRRSARALGWLSVGLGAAALVAPRRTARMIGVPLSSRTRWFLLGVGLREVGAGAGLLAAERSRVFWKWFRVAGDALDVALLVGATDLRRVRQRRLAGTLAVVSSIAMLDVVAAIADSKPSRASR